MPAVAATVLTDPYCPWSWAAEPQLRRLRVEFGTGLDFTFAIVGLKRQIQPVDAAGLAYDLVEAAAESGMPADPRAPAELWRLALEWRVRPRRVVVGELWEPA